jgi:hypothetical protein
VDSSPYSLIVISLCLALITLALRRAHGLRYWMAALCVIVLSVGLVRWFTAQKTALWIVVFLLPISTAFAAADTVALRARPWLVIIVIPFVYLATVLTGLMIGTTLGFLRP